ncbi:hypothetical protein M413DRAFT_444600 [Hebeloma cylindrosporum]|uniref:Uncharacterized protein n=1 Tax=Hebeloma cylindrosporum TaxID=76867 RepID=A0A0C3CD41_HEBCY|nr:hypothetical protein M413DRAFT_444600 [Hebeloma cylindrosporum h7]
MVRLSSVLIISTALSSVSPALSLYIPRSESSNNKSLRARGIQEVTERDVVDGIADGELQEREPILPLLGFAVAKIGWKIGRKVIGKIAGKVARKFFSHKQKRFLDESEVDALIAREMDNIPVMLKGRELTGYASMIEERGIDGHHIEFDRDFEIDGLD